MALFRPFSSAATAGKTTVQLYFDIISPYTYFQFELLTRQKTQWPSMQLQYTPVSIKNVFQSADNAPPMMVPAKGIYMMKDLSRLRKFHQIPFKMRQDFPEFAFSKGSMKTQRFFVAVQQLLGSSEADKEQYEQLIRAFFQAFFSPQQSADISDPEVIGKLAQERGLEAKLVQQALEDTNSDAVKEKLRQNNEEATARGGFGLPITTLHLPTGPESIWGSDRMHIVGHLLGESKPPIL